MKQEAKIDRTDVNFLMPVALGNIINDFMSDREIRGNRPGTITFYKNELKIFTQWLNAADARELTDITPDLLRAYFLHLRKRRSTNGIHKNFTVIRTLLLWAWIEYDQNSICPIKKVKVASPEEKEQKVISLEEFSHLMLACEGNNQDRDRAILLFLFDSGIRRQEICRIEIQAIRKNGLIQLESSGTKTGERRKIFLTRETQKALKKYLSARGELKNSDPLFATESGEPFTPSGIRQVIRRLCKRAGLNEKGMHEFRRGFALESLRGGADLVSIQKMLGHRKVETTRRYLPLDDDDLQRVHNLTSPINRVKR
jgi:integrase/recombinase XerD